MTIQSAIFANAEQSAIFLNTAEEGRILITITGDDISGGWRALYDQWTQSGGTVSAYIAPDSPVESMEAFMARNGFGVFQLLDLKDMEDKLRALSLELPTKSAAVRTWIDSTRLSFATGQSLAQPPYPYEEVAAEVLQLLNQ